MQVDIVRILVVGMIVEMHLDLVALADTDELAGHMAAEGPERVADAVGEPTFQLSHFQMDDNFRRMIAMDGGRNVGCVAQHGVLDADNRISEVLLARRRKDRAGEEGRGHNRGKT